MQAENKGGCDLWPRSGRASTARRSARFGDAARVPASLTRAASAGSTQPVNLHGRISAAKVGVRP